MIRDVVQIGDKVLETMCERVEDPNSPKVKQIVKDLLDTCSHLEHRSAGLSAPQIGVPVRICVCRRTDLEETQEAKNPDNPKEVAKKKLWEVMINPVILNKSGKQSFYWEGCLSIGRTEKDTIFGPVKRPDTIEIEYINGAGEKIKTTANGFYSHVVQHEEDHLNGILFVHLVPHPDRNLWKAPALDKYIQTNNEYPPII
jgi:peptide deformylase